MAQMLCFVNLPTHQRILLRGQGMAQKRGTPEVWKEFRTAFTSPLLRVIKDAKKNRRRRLLLVPFGSLAIAQKRFL
jgi:hypothetical protein